MTAADAPDPIGGGPSLRTRVTVAVLAAAVVPIVAVAIVLAVTGSWEADPFVGRALLVAIVLAVALGLGIAVYVVSAVTSPVRRIVEAVERTTSGAPAPIAVSGEDEIARLAESQNRLAADVERRARELARVRSAAAAATPSAGVEPLLWSAREEVAEAFGLIDAHVLRVEPETVPVEERIPGEPIPIRAELRAGEDRLGLIVGRLPATRTWERTDQDLLELYGVVVGVAMRNADLFARVEVQNRALLASDEAKDDFLRGVSHNLQTPLARIRAYAERISDETDDPRARVIAEQSERLSRMVRQLLTVTRVDAGTLRPRLEVLALGPRVRRAWEALEAEEVELRLTDESAGWLAIADGGQVDQVLWALLDNAVKYGAGAPVDVTIAPGVPGELRLTVADGGPGIDPADRDRLFGRFERGARSSVAPSGPRETSIVADVADGSGLGLYVSRALCRAMGGDLVLEADEPGRGAAFTFLLPAEVAEES
jgi:signal transduction histidine kinase